MPGRGTKNLFLPHFPTVGLACLGQGKGKVVMFNPSKDFDA